MHSINDKGSFLTENELRITHPVGKRGWFALVGFYTYAWNETSQSWINRTSISDDSDLLNGKNGAYYRDEMNHTRDFNTISASGNVDASFRITKVDCTSGNISVNLPTAVGFTGMLDLMKTDSTSNTVTVIPYLTETISGESTQTIYGQYDDITIISDNSNWFII